jgi:hypothetical protein
MKFPSIYCPLCERVVAAYTLLDGDELKLALDSDSDIEIGHPAYPADHRWTLKPTLSVRSARP